MGENEAMGEEYYMKNKDEEWKKKGNQRSSLRSKNNDEWKKKGKQ